MDRGGSLENLLKVVIKDFFTYITIISVGKNVKKHSTFKF